jgi:hypothetical protein
VPVPLIASSAPAGERRPPVGLAATRPRDTLRSSAGWHSGLEGSSSGSGPAIGTRRGPPAWENAPLTRVMTPHPAAPVPLIRVKRAGRGAPASGRPRGRQAARHGPPTSVITPRRGGPTALEGGRPAERDQSVSRLNLWTARQGLTEHPIPFTE